MLIVYWFLVVIGNTKLCCCFLFCFFSFTVRYVNFVRFSFFFFVSLGRAFGWLCLFPTIVVVYATTIQVKEFQGGLVGNRCNRSLGLTLKLTLFDVTPSVISSWDRIVACQYIPFFLYVNIFFSKCCSVNNIG